MFRRRRGGRESDPRAVGYEGSGGRRPRFGRRREGAPESPEEATGRRGCGCCSSIFVLALAVAVVGVALIA